MDIFDIKGIQPMLIKEMKEPFNNSDWIYELKLDGIRCIAYIDEKGVEFRNKRNKNISYIVPELSSVYKNVKKKCILDGELFVLKNGVPSFHDIQKRTLLTNPFKIELLAKQSPASFVAYDLIYFENKELAELPLIERKKLLATTINESENFAISRYIYEQGIELFNVAKEKQLEGVVAKKAHSFYYYGKRTSDWIKFKLMEDEYFVICGYIQKEKGMTSLIIAQYRNAELVYKEHITLGVSLSALKQQNLIERNSPPLKCPGRQENAVWLEPTLVCVVEYMPDNYINRRQAVFKGIRDDVLPIDCIES